MEIDFDPAKDAVNREKHGCSLSLAEVFEWETAWIVPDQRRDYGEDRYRAIGYVGLRLYVVIFTIREPVRRIIGVRKANPRELRQYAEA